MRTEIWEDINGYKSLYQISNKGNVRSLDRIIFRKNKIPIHVRGKTLTAVIAPNGYPVVALWKDNRGKTVYIHRLVAETLIPNPHDYPIINHKDENKANNCVENLEWCNMLYNNNYAARNQRLSLSLKNNNKLSKKIIQYSTDNQFIKEWNSIREIERVLHIPGSAIVRVCKGLGKSSHGFLWRYHNDRKE